MGQILQTPGHRLVRSHERRADVPGFGIGERRIRFFDKPAPERPHLLAIVFDRVARLVPVRVGNYGDRRFVQYRLSVETSGVVSRRYAGVSSTFA